MELTFFYIFLQVGKSKREWTRTIFLQQVLFFFFLDLDSIPFYHFLTNPFTSTEHNSPGMRGPYWCWNIQPEVLALLLLLLPSLLLGLVCTHWQQLTHTHTLAADTNTWTKLHPTSSTITTHHSSHAHAHPDITNTPNPQNPSWEFGTFSAM